MDNSELRATAAKLQSTLDSFGVRVKMGDISLGPSVTRYELIPEQGVKVSRITGLSDDIKLSLAASDIRIEAPIPGKAAVGIEVPNPAREMITLRELLESSEFTKAKSKVTFAVGKDISGKTIVTDIAKMPHLLIAGATGSGKSVLINTLIMSIIYKADPNEVKMIMVDPKMVELGLVPSFDVAKAGYAKYILNGMMTQLARIEPGKNVEESHMRNRKLICEWCYERGKADNVIEMVRENGKTYVVVNDYEKLRRLFGDMLREVQRIKSEGDYEAGKALVERYAVQVDPQLHREVRDRYYALGIEPYGGFVNPEFELVEKDGRVVDVKISYPANYVEQMLGYSKNYSFLPNIN